MTLRNYQTAAVNSVDKAWARGVQRPAVVMATGTGKSMTMGAVARREVKRGGRVLVLVHRAEIMQTISDDFNTLKLKHGRLSRGEDTSHGADVVIAMVPTLIRRLQVWRTRPPFTLVIVDECHHASAKSYDAVMRHFGCLRAKNATKTVGFTATLARGDKKPLGHVWDEVAHNLDVAWAIENEWLVPPVAKAVQVADLDLSAGNVRRNAQGDLHANDLARAVAQSSAAPAVAKAYREHATRVDGTLRPAVVFCPGVEVAEAFAKEFKKQKIRAAIVTGKTPVETRQDVFDKVRAGKLDAIINVMVLTEGFNLPELEVVVVARPTRARPLYTQMVGRVLRPSPGKDSALILDVCGRSARLGLVNPPDLGFPTEVVEGMWEQGDRDVWDPPPPPKKLTLAEMDAINGVWATISATEGLMREMRRRKLKTWDGMSMADAERVIGEADAKT
jgi:superfamily II DNA or RNA helicase